MINFFGTQWFCPFHTLTFWLSIWQEGGHEQAILMGWCVFQVKTVDTVETDGGAKQRFAAFKLQNASSNVQTADNRCAKIRVVAALHSFTLGEEEKRVQVSVHTPPSSVSIGYLSKESHVIYTYKVHVGVWQHKHTYRLYLIVSYLYCIIGCIYTESKLLQSEFELWKLFWGMDNTLCGSKGITKRKKLHIEIHLH